MRRALGTREMLLGIPRVIWDDVTKIDLKETEIDGMELIIFLGQTTGGFL
jgi:hypothetical protein